MVRPVRVRSDLAVVIGYWCLIDLTPGNRCVLTREWFKTKTTSSKWVARACGLSKPSETEPALGPWRRGYSNVLPEDILRRRNPLELERGMRRPFLLRPMIQVADSL